MVPFRRNIEVVDMKNLNKVFRWIIIGAFLLVISVSWYAVYQYRNKLIMNNKLENEFYTEFLCIDGDFKYGKNTIIADNILVDRKELAYRVGYFNFYELFSFDTSMDELLDDYDSYLSHTVDGGPYVFCYFWKTKEYMNYPISYEEYKALVENVLNGYRYETDSNLNEEEFDADELFGEYIYCDNCTDEQIELACNYVNQNEGANLYKDRLNVR